MKQGALYLAFRENERNDLEKLDYDRSMSAQLFAEMNSIEYVIQVSDCSDLFWKAREGMKFLITELEKYHEKIDCVVVYNYQNLIYEQSDFNALKRMLEGYQIELISITRGEIEVECDYYYEP